VLPWEIIPILHGYKTKFQGQKGAIAKLRPILVRQIKLLIRVLSQEKTLQNRAKKGLFREGGKRISMQSAIRLSIHGSHDILMKEPNILTLKFTECCTVAR